MDSFNAIFNSLKIQKLPEVLMLHLKRFKFSETGGVFGGGQMKKLSYRVSFPDEIRIMNTASTFNI